MGRISLIDCPFAIYILYNIGTRMVSRNTLGGVFVTLMLLAACAKAMDQFGSDVGVTFGSIVRIISPQTGFIVHSHDIFFGRGGVMSVTGYRIDDLGSYWQLSQKHQTATKTVFDPLLCGDTVTVSSAIMGYFLRAEETQFGLTTELLPMVHGMGRNNLDDKINWQLQCMDRHEGQQLHYNDRIRLKHQITGKYVSLDDAYAYTEANCRGCSIIGQLELHALDTADDTTIFQIKTGIAFDKDYVESQ